MKKLILITTLLFCSVSNGQEFYELVKEQLAHIRCEANSTKSGSVNGEFLAEDEPFKDTYLYAFSDNYLFYHHPRTTDYFSFLAYKDSNGAGWNYLNEEARSNILITDNVIRYTSKAIPNTIDGDMMLTSHEYNITIDRITGTLISNFKGSYVALEGTDETLDIIIENKGICSPYDPDQRAF